MNKHYIRLDENLNIIKGFSDAFDEPLETDICINEDGGRHFELNGLINPSLICEKGSYLYKWIDGSEYCKTCEELQLEYDLLPTPPLTLEERLLQAEEEIQLGFERYLQTKGVWG